MSQDQLKKCPFNCPLSTLKWYLLKLCKNLILISLEKWDDAELAWQVRWSYIVRDESDYNRDCSFLATHFQTLRISKFQASKANTKKIADHWI